MARIYIISQLWSENINKRKERSLRFELSIGQPIWSLHVGNWATMDDFFSYTNIRK